MKVAKLILSVIIIVLAVLGAFDILNVGIVTPVMLLALGTYLVIRSLECRARGEERRFALMAAAAAFLYCVVIYHLLSVL